MTYRGIFEYEYPVEHKEPVGIDVYLHGDCVKGKIIEWEYKALEQEPILDKIRAEIMELDYKDYDGEEGTNIPPMIYRDHVFDIFDKYKAETEAE